MRAYLFAVSLVCAAPPVLAQELTAICQSMTDGRLIDSSSSSFVLNQMESEFHSVCSNESTSESRLKSSSKGFQAGFNGYSLGFSGASSGGSTSERIKAACDKGASSFTQYVSSEMASSTGSVLASYVVDCLKIAAEGQTETILGTTIVDDSDEGFVVNVSYNAGPVPLSYQLSQIAAPPTVDCSSADADKKSLPLVTLAGRSRTAFFCKKPKGVGVKGSFVFSANFEGKSYQKVVSFDVASVDKERETAQQILSRVSQIDQRVQDQIRGLQGSVDANLTSMSQQITGLQGRSLACRSYGSAADRPRSAFCSKPAEKIMSCIFGKNHSSYSLIDLNGVQGCENQNRDGDWGVAVCCQLSE